MAAIAERPTEVAPRPNCESAFASPRGLGPTPLALPPGSVPVGAVRSAIRRYGAGIGTAEQLIATVDRHAEALEPEIAGKAVEHLAEFQRAIDRADLLAGYVSMRLAQLEWLKRFPGGPEREVVPSRRRVSNHDVAVTKLPAVIRHPHDLEIPLQPRRPSQLTPTAPPICRARLPQT